MAQASYCWKRFPQLTDDDFVTDFTQCLYLRNEDNPPPAAMNTYLKNFEVPQVLLFDILANRFPLFQGAQSVLIKRILQTAARYNRITLLDLGCGRGEQLVRILNALNAVALLKQVTVIGAEIDEATLHFCTNYIRSRQHEYHYTLEFNPLPGPVENLSPEKISALLPDDHAALFINASLVLHHIQDQDDRQRLFETLFSLKPVSFTLIEPDTDAFTNEFDERILHVWEHFGSIYSYINGITASAAEKKGLKQFFRNELYDTLVLPDTHRFEKYWPAATWLGLAHTTGFMPAVLNLPDPAPELTGLTTATNAGGCYTFSYNGTSLLSVMGFSI